MPVYSAEAVVLRKVDYGEADRILTLFTRERGKLPAIAKAVRRAKSRMSGQLDVFSHGQMLLAEGRRMDVVTQFQRITRSDGLAADLPRGAAAAVVVEVADKVLEERHPQPELFEVVVGALDHLSQPWVSARLELCDFLMRVLGELGYTPALADCARCGKPIGETGLGFSPIWALNPTRRRKPGAGTVGPSCMSSLTDGSWACWQLKMRSAQNQPRPSSYSTRWVSKWP